MFVAPKVAKIFLFVSFLKKFSHAQTKNSIPLQRPGDAPENRCASSCENMNMFLKNMNTFSKNMSMFFPVRRDVFPGVANRVGKQMKG